MATPDYLLFAQHGWADNGSALADLARQVTVDSQAHVEAPSLNYVQTWLRIEPLIQAVEAQAAATLQRYPQVPVRVIGHSMGGLIWLEVLQRHPDWWSRLASLVLLASPVGGADLGRRLDPLGIGVGIAADLGVNRRPLAEALAAAVPTLVMAGDVDGGSDGTIPVEATKVDQARFLCLAGVSHPHMRNHPAVATAIRRFWAGEPMGALLQSRPVVRYLRQVPGMTDTHPREFDRARVIAQFPDGSTLRLWSHPLGMPHVYVAAADGVCCYSAFVGWRHRPHLRRALRLLPAAAVASG